MNFRPANLNEYLQWLHAYVEAGGEITHAYNYPWERKGMLVAQHSFTTGGECGAQAVCIIVPPGVHYLGGDLGHNSLYLHDGPRCLGRWVPVYSDSEFDGVPGVAEARQEDARREREFWQRQRHRQQQEELNDSDVSTYLRGGRRYSTGPGRVGESSSLHAHEITSDDATFLRMMSASTFSPDSIVTLPSGRAVSGAEIMRWLTTD